MRLINTRNMEHIKMYRVFRKTNIPRLSEI